MTPPEVAPLLGRFHLPELTVFPVLLAEVNAVSAIFMVVPCVVISAIPIVVPFVMMIVSPHRPGACQGNACEKRGKNQKKRRMSISCLSTGHVAGPFLY